MTNSSDIELRSVNTLRFLAVDAIQAANSGHPGLPLGAAPMAYVLWARHLRHDPADPTWVDRDRFVLSAGHGSSLLYALLHLSGYDLPLEELQAFRQLESRAAGHPESHLLPGVEVTTGPLGQGVANAVGLAMAERHLAAIFNRPGQDIMDHHTYVIASDGDLMEGVCYEACALAGHLKLGKLIVLFDSNEISLAGTTSLSTSEDVEARFAAIDWHTVAVEDGNNLDAIDRAIAAAKREASRPTLLLIKTVIGYGSPNKQGSHKAHGSPLGSEEVAATKAALRWPADPPFLVDEGVRRHFRSLATQGTEQHAAWKARLAAYAAAHPDLAREFNRRASGCLPADWQGALPSFDPDPKGLATRQASETVLQSLAKMVPELIGGSADLNPSTLTWLKGFGDFEAPGSPPLDLQGAVGKAWGYSGRNIHFGVREHAMGSIVNGMAQHGGLIPYASTFLVFSDYMRPAIRLAALSGYPSLFIFTHDSIGVGEDGPTHQPIEQLMSLRLIPNLAVFRPSDANETAESWRAAIERRNSPSVLVLSRQALPTFDRSDLAPASEVRRGGYVLWESAETPELILMATGSEVALALQAGRKLADEGRRVRVVSLPSWELFDRQPSEYRNSVLPPSVTTRIAIEAGRSLGWERYTGLSGRVIGMDSFGASGPGPAVFAHFGFSVEAIVTVAREVLAI